MTGAKHLMDHNNNVNNFLLLNLDKLHTTDMGIVRIKKNLSIDTEDVIGWCKEKIKNPSSSINRRGKNWYVTIDNYIITINAYSYTVITAHVIKKAR